MALGAGRWDVIRLMMKGGLLLALVGVLAGSSAAYDVVAQTGGTCIREEMLLADLGPEKLSEARSKPNYALRHRRPELYKAISEPLRLHEEPAGAILTSGRKFELDCNFMIVRIA